MKNMFVLETDDPDFKTAILEFIQAHCRIHNINAAVFETTESGRQEIKKILHEKQ